MGLVCCVEKEVTEAVVGVHYRDLGEVVISIQGEGVECYVAVDCIRLGRKAGYSDAGSVVLQQRLSR